MQLLHRDNAEECRRFKESCCWYSYIQSSLRRPSLIQHTGSEVAPSPTDRQRSEANVKHNSQSDQLASSLGNLAGMLRRCCKLWESTCVGKACCFYQAAHAASSKQAVARVTPCSKASPECTKELKLVDDGSKLGSEPLTLEITGMDCADCAPRVGRALSRLPS